MPISGGNYPSLYRHGVSHDKETNNSKFGSEIKFRNLLGFAQNPCIVDNPRGLSIFL